MITPKEIEEKVFTKALRGYKDEEVDSFLNLIIAELELLKNENENLAAENKRLSDELKNTKSSEEQVLETLESARKLMDEISLSAEKRADVLLKNAELDADLIKREAFETTERLTEESTVLRNRISNLREKYRSLLETELERFDVLSSEIFLEADEIVKSIPETVKESAANTDTVIIESVKDIEEIQSSQEDGNVDLTKTIVNIR